MSTCAKQEGLMSIVNIRPRSGADETDQWNCSSSVEPVSAVTDEAPPWMTVVTSSK